MDEKERQNHKMVQVVRDERGATLVIFLLLLSALAALAFGALKVTTLNLEASLAHNKSKQAFYNSEVGLELAVNDIIRSFEALIPYTTSALNGGDANGFLAMNNYRGYSVQYKITQEEDRFLYQTVKGQDILTHYAYTYDIEAISTSLTDKTMETLKERIRILETPLVQWFIFYAGQGTAADLEIHSGSDWTGWGRIHTNGDFYIGSTQGASHRFQNFDPNGGNPIQTPHAITVSGSVIPQTKVPVFNFTGSAPGFAPIPFGFTVDTTAQIKTTNTTTTWVNPRALDLTINAGNEAAQEPLFNDFVLVNEQIQNTPQQIVIRRNGFYDLTSRDPQLPEVDGIHILGTGGVGAGNIEVNVSRPVANTNVTALIAAGQTSPGVNYTGPMPIIRELLNDFGDCRESRNVDTTDIDLHALTLWFREYLADPVNGGGDMGDNGLVIYASRSPNAAFTNAGDPMQAIRLRQIGVGSSPQLQINTTFVTDNPLYIQGDFNTVNQKGVALIADSINVLSNGWTTKACNVNMPPTNTATSVNAAFFTGNSETIGAFAGGAINYPRFHERWGFSPNNTPFNYRGAFVNLWTSTQANGNFCLGGNCYSAPTRNWGWDTNFGDPDYWPPYIPSVYEVQRVGFNE